MIVSWDVQITILLDRAFIHAGSSENQHELFLADFNFTKHPNLKHGLRITYHSQHIYIFARKFVDVDISRTKIDQFQRTALCHLLPSNRIRQEGHGSKFSNQQNRKSFMPIRSRFIHMYQRFYILDWDWLFFPALHSIFMVIHVPTKQPSRKLNTFMGALRFQNRHRNTLSTNIRLRMGTIEVLNINQINLLLWMGLE